MSTWIYDATVLRVVDGDTVDLEIDLGFRATFTDRFRFFGMNCPERGQEGWATASAFVSQRLPVGGKILVQTFHPKIRDPRDGFGRWLATIFLPGVQTSLNDLLVQEGLAVKWTR